MPLMSPNILCRCHFCIMLPLCISYILHKELPIAKLIWNVSSLRYPYTQVIRKQQWYDGLMKRNIRLCHMHFAVKVPSWCVHVMTSYITHPHPPPHTHTHTHTNTHSNYSTYLDNFHGVWKYLSTSNIFYEAHSSRITLFYPGVHHADENLLQFHVQLIVEPWSKSHHCGFRWCHMQSCSEKTVIYILDRFLIIIVNYEWLKHTTQPLVPSWFCDKNIRGICLTHRPGLTFWHNLCQHLHIPYVWGWYSSITDEYNHIQKLCSSVS